MISSNRARRARTKGALVVCLVVVAAAALYATVHYNKGHIPPPPAAKGAHTPPKPPVAQQAANRGLPRQLVIPKLNISAKIGYMGLTKQGAMEVPNNVHDVGWYKYGALPGNAGSAVIAGHLDGIGGTRGVFMDLGTLQKGDSVSVVDDSGRDARFVVREIRTYAHDEQPTEVFKGSEGIHLNLITCTGPWDKDQHQFTQRLVVFADQSL